MKLSWVENLVSLSLLDPPLLFRPNSNFTAVNGSSDNNIVLLNSSSLILPKPDQQQPHHHPHLRRHDADNVDEDVVIEPLERQGRCVKGKTRHGKELLNDE